MKEKSHKGQRHKGCGLCTPEKRIGNAAERRPASDRRQIDGGRADQADAAWARSGWLLRSPRVKRQPRTPPQPTWRSGPSFPLGAAVTGRCKTVTDFEIAVVQSGATGSHMEWRSATLGLLTPFDSYHWE